MHFVPKMNGLLNWSYIVNYVVLHYIVTINFITSTFRLNFIYITAKKLQSKAHNKSLKGRINPVPFWCEMKSTHERIKCVYQTFVNNFFFFSIVFTQNIPFQDFSYYPFTKQKVGINVNDNNSSHKCSIYLFASSS